jgi:hypothetical protein
MKQLSARRDTEASMEEVERAIEKLCRENVLLSLNGKLLGVGVNYPSQQVVS